MKFMAAAAGRQHPLRFASALGPLALLLLPKCPLCLLPLLAFLGLAIPASTGLWIAAGVVVALWLGVLLVAARKHNRILLAALFAAAVAVAAIGVQSRVLLGVAIFAMSAAGIVLTRSCTHRHA